MFHFGNTAAAKKAAARPLYTQNTLESSYFCLFIAFFIAFFRFCLAFVLFLPHNAAMQSKDAIKTWMTASNTTRPQLAAALGVSLNSLNKWLSTTREIPARRMAAIEQLMRATDAAAALSPVCAFAVRFTAAEWASLQAAHGISTAAELESLLRRLALQN